MIKKIFLDLDGLLADFDGAKYFFSNVEELNPIILTSCPTSRYEEVARQKREWVRKHLSSDILVLPVRGSQYKPLFMHSPGDILIDDYKPNVKAWADAGGIAIKHDGDFPQTWLDLMTALRQDVTHLSIRRGEIYLHQIHHDVGIDA